MADLPKVTQLVGPGVDGLEADPPLYHFDLEPAQVFEMAADPVGFLKRLGLTPAQGIGSQGEVTVRMPDPTLQWSHQKAQWVRGGFRFDENATASKPVGCCYVVDSEVICHVHLAEVKEA